MDNSRFYLMPSWNFAKETNYEETILQLDLRIAFILKVYVYYYLEVNDTQKQNDNSQRHDTERFIGK